MGSEDSDRWQQIKDLYDAVIHLGPIERERVLDAACRCDAELRREVESLREDRAADFMESPAYKVLANFPTSVRLKNSNAVKWREFLPLLDCVANSFPQTLVA